MKHTTNQQQLLLCLSSMQTKSMEPNSKQFLRGEDDHAS